MVVKYLLKSQGGFTILLTVVQLGAHDYFSLPSPFESPLSTIQHTDGQQVETTLRGRVLRILNFPPVAQP